MSSSTDFIPAHRADIATLAAVLSQRLGQPVAVEYGTTDSGTDHWAALMTDDYRSPGPLVSILTGEGTPRDGFEVMGRNGGLLTGGVTLTAALRAAKVEAVREHRRQTRAARLFAQ